MITTIVFSGPLINWMNELNQHLTLPSALKGIEEWMRNAEDRATELTKVFLETTSYSGLAVNLFVIALLPAIGEELLFRGAVQRLLIDLTKNKHAGIVLSAIAFSALHMQFYGFVPRMMLGIFFGYVVLWSGSLWPAIMGHFINNATAVIMMFLQKRNQLPFDPDTIGTQPGDELFLMISTLITLVCIWAIFRRERKNEAIPPGINI